MTKETAGAELEENFKYRKEGKQPALSSFTKAARAITRMSDASSSLDDSIDDFVQTAISSLASAKADAETRRKREVKALEARLAHAETARGTTAQQLERECADERLQRLRAALRLTGNWKSAVVGGKRECDALQTLLCLAVSEVEKAWRADVHDARADVETLVRALKTCEAEHEELVSPRCPATTSCQPFALPAFRPASCPLTPKSLLHLPIGSPHACCWCP